MFSRHHVSSSSSGSIISTIERDDVSVFYESSRCDGAEVACRKMAEPAVEIYVEPQSVILDFSNVAEPGAFEDADFEGYVVEILRGRDTPILFAWIDFEATTLDIGDERLRYDEDSFEINLAGVVYDSTAFVKINLLVGPLKILGGGQ